PDDAVALIRANLRPAPGKPLTAAEARRLIADLSADDFETRDRASRALAVPSALPHVEAAAKTETDLEARRRLQRLLADGRTWPGPGGLRAVRAVEVLERAGTPEARRLLEELAGGNPDARLTHEARASRGRTPR
ncbi:MAG: WD40 repeat domain-containing protein, partial [Gemmataceae bacterium]